MQEHALQGGRGWMQTPSFNLKDLQAALCHACNLAAGQASIAWGPLQEIMTTAAHGAGLGQHDRLLLRALAAQVLDERVLQGVLQRVAQQGGLSLSSSLEGFR